jgi:hypothetical protein
MPKSAGYSGTPLLGKLGIVPGTTVVAVGAPKHYAELLGPLPLGAKITKRMPKAPAFVHLFTASRATLGTELSTLRAVLERDGVVWVSWPKKSSGVATDITEDTIRQVCLPMGFVDVKVCAVDETWSGLKLVIRRELRKLGTVSTG